VRCIFFDLGSTLWDDYPATLFIWRLITSLLNERGLPVTLEQITAKAHEVIASYSPSLNRAIIWQYVDGDRASYEEIVGTLVSELRERLDDPAEFRRLSPLFPGVREMLETLAKQYPLAVVSQHFAGVESWMGYHDIGGYFRHVTVSERERLYKPDPRLFLTCCNAVAVEPRDVLMVGDRLDNDIWPANRLRMTTVRVLSQPYRVQRPRYHTDAPDYTLEHTADLPQVLPELKH
jgi:HAD superfamily hydrolase (TIGR01549 family)